MMRTSIFKYFNNLSLGIKAALVTASSLLAVSILFTAFFYNFHKQSSLRELGERSMALARNLSYNCHFAVISNNYEIMTNLIEGVTQEEDIIRAFIIDSENTIISSSDESYLGHKMAQDLPITMTKPEWGQVLENQVYRAISPVISEQRTQANDESFLLTPNGTMSNSIADNKETASTKVVGYAVLDVSLKKMNENLESYLWKAVLIALMLGFAGALSAAIVVHKLIQPLKNLADVTKEIAQGKFGITIPVVRADEIGALSKSFNDMSLKLKRSQDDYVALNSEMERKVKESTKELRVKYMSLEQALENSKTKDLKKNDFLAFMGHEMRSPISAIQLFSELMLQDIGKSDAQQADSLSTIINNCQRLSRLIDEVLDCMKLEEGKMKFHCAEFELTAAIEETIQLLTPSMNNKQLKCNFYGQDKQLLINSDKDRVIQVLTNIISNSIKFSHKGGKIDIYLEDQLESVEIIISDQGKGIKKSELTKVFDKYNSLQEFQQNLKSTGLGMYLSKSIVENLGGTIEIESQFGKGTTVHFTLAKNGSEVIKNRRLEE